MKFFTLNVDRLENKAGNMNILLCFLMNVNYRYQKVQYDMLLPPPCPDVIYIYIYKVLGISQVAGNSSHSSHLSSLHSGKHNGHVSNI